MKLTIEQPALMGAISQAISAAPARATIPILQNFLIEAHGGIVKLTATDLDIEVSATASASVDVEGRTTVSARTLSDVVKRMPKGALVSLDLDSDILTVKAGRIKASIATLDARDFPEMASVPIAGLTALQALITHGQLKEGETVLINGASGGVGHFAVQIAKAYGAKVTAVCSGKNMDFVKSLGADQVIAYDQTSIHQHNGKYDLVVDTNGNLFHQDYRRMGHRGVMVGFTTMGHMISLLLKKSINKFPLAQFTVEANTKDLQTLASLVRDGKIKPYIERTYAYQDIPAAIRYIESMRTKGKVTMVW